MADKLDIAPILEFVYDPRFRDLLRESTREYLPWERLLERPLPNGVSATDAWNILGAFRRIDAIFNPITDVEERTFWYAPTQRINASVSRIAEACRDGSPLHESLRDSSNKQYLVRSRIEESVACARMDGFVIPLEETLQTLSMDRAPRTAGERLIANSISLADTMRDYVGEPMSPEMLRELGDRMLDGVDVDKLETAERRRGPGSETYDPEVLARRADDQLKKTCSYANGIDADPFDHPVVRALLLRDSTRGYRVVPPVSAMVARLAFMKYTLENGLPVLSAMPLAKAALEWEDGKRVVRPFDKDVVYYKSTVPYAKSEEADITPFVTISAQLALEELEELEEYFEQGNQRDSELRELLRENQELNYRQRSILGRAIRDPEARFGIRYHRTRHNVAYATARADLLGLVELGYLVCEEEGQAFRFHRGPRLDGLLKAKQQRTDPQE